MNSPLCSRMKKHPHARGEDGWTKRVNDLRKETPPRTWGRQDDEWPAYTTGRNTPTHVGKTFTFPSLAMTLRKHPHARGEDSPACSATGGNEETPPRTWGRLQQALDRIPDAGNTPTHVGKTGLH